MWVATARSEGSCLHLEILAWSLLESWWYVVVAANAFLFHRKVYLHSLASFSICHSLRHIDQSNSKDCVFVPWKHSSVAPLEAECSIDVTLQLVLSALRSILCYPQTEKYTCNELVVGRWWSVRDFANRRCLVLMEGLWSLRCWMQQPRFLDLCGTPTPECPPKDATVTVRYRWYRRRVSK
jgi:hypothetical protein